MNRADDKNVLRMAFQKSDSNALGGIQVLEHVVAEHVYGVKLHQVYDHVSALPSLTARCCSR